MDLSEAPASQQCEQQIHSVYDDTLTEAPNIDIFGKMNKCSIKK